MYESDCQAGEEPFETIDVCTRRVVEEGMGGARNMAGLDVALAAWEGAVGYALGAHSKGRVGGECPCVQGVAALASIVKCAKRKLTKNR